MVGDKVLWQPSNVTFQRLGLLTTTGSTIVIIVPSNIFQDCGKIADQQVTDYIFNLNLTSCGVQAELIFLGFANGFEARMK